MNCPVLVPRSLPASISPHYSPPTSTTQTSSPPRPPSASLPQLAPSIGPITVPTPTEHAPPLDHQLLLSLLPHHRLLDVPLHTLPISISPYSDLTNLLAPVLIRATPTTAPAPLTYLGPTSRPALVPIRASVWEKTQAPAHLQLARFRATTMTLRPHGVHPNNDQSDPSALTARANNLSLDDPTTLDASHSPGFTTHNLLHKRLWAASPESPPRINMNIFSWNYYGSGGATVPMLNSYLHYTQANLAFISETKCNISHAIDHISQLPLPHCEIVASVGSSSGLWVL